MRKKNDIFVNHLLLVHSDYFYTLIRTHTKAIFDTLILRAHPASLFAYLNDEVFLSYAHKHHPDLIPNILNQMTNTLFILSLSDSRLLSHLQKNIESYAASKILNKEYKIFLITLKIDVEKVKLNCRNFSTLMTNLMMTVEPQEHQERIAKLNGYLTKLTATPAKEETKEEKKETREETKEERKIESKPTSPSAAFFAPKETSPADGAEIKKSSSSCTRTP